MSAQDVPESLDREKARRAAKHPDRPGEKCGAAPGAWRPVVDRGRCEGKHDCVDVCPYGVFEVRAINAVDFQAPGSLCTTPPVAAAATSGRLLRWTSSRGMLTASLRRPASHPTRNRPAWLGPGLCRGSLSFLGRLKSRAHGRQTAYTPNAEACRGCGLCVVACPERAIRLEQAGNAP